ncbi:unnamed protein product [Lactuca saligna]|uniref:Uncharacterized protein n=1 Tax=Lactuca saligna TaxID=75948 RepID=A0AA36E7P9_LACSI|nr:unnamed protein product [Lactuca saligna]
MINSQENPTRRHLCCIHAPFPHPVDDVYPHPTRTYNHYVYILEQVSEFKAPKSVEPNSPKDQFQWLYTNGLLGIIFSFGLLFTALRSRRARSWLYGTGCLRSFIVDYGVPLMVVVLYIQLLWDFESLYHWTVIKDMGKVPPVYILAAFIPAVMIVGLYLFDHSIASMNKDSSTFYNLFS